MIEIVVTDFPLNQSIDTRIGAMYSPIHGEVQTTPLFAGLINAGNWSFNDGQVVFPGDWVER